jgi:hypothetical protein
MQQNATRIAIPYLHARPLPSGAASIPSQLGYANTFNENKRRIGFVRPKSLPKPSTPSKPATPNNGATYKRQTGAQPSIGLLAAGKKLGLK